MLKAREASESAEELAVLRTTVRRFLEREVVPYRDAWREAGVVARSVWNKAGDAGLLCASVPEAYGGGGASFRAEAVIVEEMARIAFVDFRISLHNCMVAPYIVHYGS